MQTKILRFCVFIRYSIFFLNTPKKQFLYQIKIKMEPRLVSCRACRRCAEKMNKCPICKEQFKIDWYCKIPDILIFMKFVQACCV